MPSSAPQPPLDIAIIGGGIAGLTLAIGLLKQPNTRASIYESAKEFHEIGAGVLFGPNATHAMALLDPGITRGLQKCSTSNPGAARDVWVSIHHGEGGDATTHHTYDVPCPADQAMVHRADFLSELVGLVPRGVAQFGKRVVGLEELGDGRLRLRFQDGAEATHDVAVGCDGVRSEVRKYILGEDDPAAYAMYTGKYAYRGLIPMQTAAGLLGDELAQKSTLYYSHRGHIMTYPVQHGRVMNVAGISSKPTWDAPTWAAPLSRSTLTTAFEHYTAPIQALLHTISSHDVWALFDHGGTHAAATYIKGHACIAGDAAHATTPHLGAGAGMAVEDAYVLAGLLGQAAARWKRGTAADKPDPIARALYAYDSVRRGRTQRLVGASREAGEFWGFEVEDVGMDEERLAKRVREMFDWIWSEDVQVELEAGKRIMDEVV